MAKLPQDGVRADTPTETHVRIRFPQGVRLHNGRFGKFSAIGRHGNITVKSDAHSVLSDILHGLESELEDLIEITGDYMTLNVKVHCASAADSVIRHVAVACSRNRLPFSYKAGRQLCTVQPLYAV